LIRYISKLNSKYLYSTWNRFK